MFKSLLKGLTAALIGNALLFAGAQAASAGTVLENIARTGVFKVGTSFDAVPYSYYNDKEEHVGYSIDIVNLIRDSLEKELGREIELQFVEVNSVAEAFPKLASREIDITCNVAFTFARDEYFDYTARYGVTGTRLLANTSEGSSFAGKTIGVPKAVFTQKVMELEYPQATLKPFDTMEEAIESLKSGSIAAIAGDGVILDGIRQQIGSEDFTMIPKRGEPPFARFGVGCIVPPNNSAFLNIADKTIITMMEGYVVGNDRYVDLVETWFGPEGVIQVVEPAAIKEFFETNVLFYEQIPFED